MKKLHFCSSAHFINISPLSVPPPHISRTTLLKRVRTLFALNQRCTLANMCAFKPKRASVQSSEYHQITQKFVTEIRCKNNIQCFMILILKGIVLDSLMANTAPRNPLQIISQRLPQIECMPSKHRCKRSSPLGLLNFPGGE
jgi:hypothetical protein